ncbi:MAG: cation transporter [Sphingobacteriales bacterium 17-39-43]|uniref:efflux RND transporter permease subunit n=1 Tax=Daejeonella sp. TaxID=2805397 RepID=UPI000BCB9606|nr:efflux RND transporter permease subunit [Daejeonella sp.]OYZ33241.1 MAG: cation transporter [Sphingobacteriales bacterium 16-39-50]OYZ59738.1 MAG: cation transporter [Sphingobacteriales bacterium 24-40-4]OZA26650.1 MAG: cation transporter [Sphingobacteriales bacterium 17-39-43]HQS04326.1 efflux RND transporter permease subunit [Daejeonella sp.]HQT21813.1 efflux RND transporter permease subunit [Daejeonella sp.]
MGTRKFNIIELAMKHKQIAIIITVMLVLFGVFSLWVMPRNEFPEFTIRQGLIIGVFPGATSEQVEDQLASKVENFLYGFKEVNREKTYSISKEGMLIVFVEVNNNVKDPDGFWDKIKFGLSELKMQLPPQVVALIANNDFGDTAALLLTVQSESKTYKELEDELKIIETELRKIQAVSKVKHYGLLSEEITIYLDNAKLAYYGVRPITVLAAMQLEGAVYYGGELDNSELITPIHIPANYKSEEDIKRQIVYADPTGNIIRVKDIATVVRKYKEPDSYIKNNGSNSLLISLEMQPGNNIVDFGKQVDGSLDSIRTKISPDVNLDKIADMPAAVDYSILHFLREFFIAIIAVIIVTMLLLPFRVATVAGITIPISIFITIGILYLLGIELHTVSLAGLIVVLGMVVDNAIVVIDSHVEKIDHGDTPWDAAWKSATELFVPVFSATLAIIATYIPLVFFLSGMTGDFVGSLPVTIGVALFTSLLVAYFLVPYMSYVFIKKGVKKEETKPGKKSLLDRLQYFYNRTLEKAFGKPMMTIFIGVLSIVLGGAILALLPRQLFPKVERNQFAVEIYLPEGYTLEQTATVADSLEASLMSDNRVVNVASFVGTSSPRFHTTYAPNFPSKNYAQLVVNTKTAGDAVALLGEYEKTKRNTFPNAYVRMKQLDMLGTNAPIEVRISGNNLDSIKTVAENVKHIMQQNEGVIWARTDYLNLRQGVHVDVNDELANRLGLTRGVIASSIASGFSGIPIGTVWEGDYPIDVKVINPTDKRDGFDDIENQNVTSLFLNATVPVRQVATLTNDWSEGQIIRRNGIRTITVRGDVKRGVLPYKIFSELKGDINNIKTDSDVQIAYGGEEESEVENYVPLSKALLAGVLLIFFILLFQFKKPKLVFLVMVTMPLSFLGAAIGLVLTGYPFGLTSFLGIMSLMGIVVRNGIILIDYAEELRGKNGMPLAEAAIAAGKRRMRPIFLTSFAAAMGVVPMILSGSSLWGPLGAVVCFGLLVSMILTLYILPVLYHQSLKKTHA